MLLIAVLVGCDRGSGADNVNADARVGGAAPPSVPPILQPFQGAWRFNQTKTLAQWQADGVPPTEIAETQKIAADPNDPDVSKTPLLDGNAATCTADALTDPPWSPWRTYVFDRDEQKK